MTTKSQDVAADVVALLRARTSLLWIVTREEARVERYLFEAAAAAGYEPRTWDVACGVRQIYTKPRPSQPSDPAEALAEIESAAIDESRSSMRGAWILRDMHAWVSGPVGASICRGMRNLARLLPTIKRERAQAMIVLTPSGDVPPELAGHATVIEWPLPDREEVAAVLDAAIEGLPDDMRATAAPNGQRDAAIDAAVGLSGEEAASCYARSLVQLRRIDPAAVAREKKRVIARERVLEWFDPLPGGLASVGGLENLKEWLRRRASAYTPQAREFGLPAPKGVFLVGVPGCGKSLTAKAIATTWGVPLLKLDMGALKSKFVGESEGNLRRAFRVIEAIGRCVVWIDEIEKAMQGSTSGSSDGGVSADALGAVLNWMQERRGDAFVVATANDAEQLPPELLRKGRFDEVWWVDTPTSVERVEVLAASLRAYGRSVADVEADRICEAVAATAGFTGSEIAATVPDALFAAFDDGARALTVDDLLAAAKTVVPLTSTAKEKIGRLRDWATGRARPASRPDDVAAPASSGRVLDL